MSLESILIKIPDATQTGSHRPGRWMAPKLAIVLWNSPET